jgi:hypothetical protein
MLEWKLIHSICTLTEVKETLASTLGSGIESKVAKSMLSFFLLNVDSM